MQLIYLALSLWGAIHPMAWFVTWLRSNDWDIGAMIDAWYVNSATTGLTWDLTIAAVTLTVWIVAESRPKGRRLGLVAIPATFCIGVSCGLPLYLWLRSRDG